MEYAEKQTPPPAPIKFDYRAMTKEEERRFTKDFRGEGWEHGALTRLTRDDGWPKWAVRRGDPASAEDAHESDQLRRLPGPSAVGAPAQAGRGGAGAGEARRDDGHRGRGGSVKTREERR